MLKQFMYKELENQTKDWCKTSNKWTMRVYYPYGKPRLARQYAQMSQESIDDLKTKKEVLSSIFKPKI